MINFSPKNTLCNWTLAGCICIITGRLQWRNHFWCGPFLLFFFTSLGNNLENGLVLLWCCFGCLLLLSTLPNAMWHCHLFSVVWHRAQEWLNQRISSPKILFLYFFPLKLLAIYQHYFLSFYSYFSFFKKDTFTIFLE